MSENAATHHPDRVWYELSVEADAEAVEPISELLGRYGFNQGVAIDEPYVQDGDGDNLEVDVSKPVVIRTWIPEKDLKPERMEELRGSLRLLGKLRAVGELQIDSLKEEDWANSWKEHFQVHRIGERVVIRPPWREFDPGPADVEVVLDPGMAFGTGLHPTTRLSVRALERVVQPGDRVLDVGTGSGILAIAAVKLGASQVDAVDVESVAVDATRENAERNRVDSSIAVEQGSVGAGEPFQAEYDLVLANIIARILIELSESLVRQTRSGGHLILAGIIEPRESEVHQVFTELGMEILERNQHEDWICLLLRKPEVS